MKKGSLQFKPDKHGPRVFPRTLLLDRLGTMYSLEPGGMYAEGALKGNKTTPSGQAHGHVAWGPAVLFSALVNLVVFGPNCRRRRA